MPSPTSRSVDDLVRVLELDAVAPDRFRSIAIDTEQRRIYGGQLVAQSLMAAGRSAPADRDVHSLHAYFLRGGTPSASIDFAVEPIRESSTFTTFRVVAEQEGRALLSLEASFHAEESGPAVDEPLPTVPRPDEMVAIDDWALAQAMPDRNRDVPYFVDAFEWRQAADTLPDGRTRHEHEPVRDVWMRIPSQLTGGSLLHACALAYASDKPLLGTAVLAPPVCADPSRFLVASLDHSMWFHRPCRADEWTLFHLHSSTSGHGRAFGRAECFRDDGALGFSAAQQGLVRPLQ